MSRKFDFKEWLLNELIIAYHEARRNGKRKTKNEHEFEMNEIENLVVLRDAIMMRKYKPNKGIAFIIHDPVSREIFAAPFIDRIVHHFLYKHAISWWEPRLWRGAYSCRKGKGTLAGILDLQKNMRIVSRDGSVATIVVKRDFKGYFMSLDHDKLYARICWGLKRQYPNGGELYRTLKYLWKEIIFDEPVKGVKIRGSQKEWEDLPVDKSLFFQPKGLGIVIGNLTSQLLSNIFLDMLDRFIVYELGYKAYGRYVDDFYIVVTVEELPKLLNEDMVKIERFAESLGLTIHPKKQYEIPIENGVDFLGAKVYLDRILPGPRALKNLADKVYLFETRGEGNVAGFGSYDGLFAHYNSEKAVRKIYDGVGWDYANRPSRNRK
ncbi:RNA-directed DNA polymerase [Candidatus Saccharibacteria bacterium]|nr:RNA-directed DNA polymerase [Candidatus Saccharibacteria bacterium]